MHGPRTNNYNIVTVAASHFYLRPPMDDLVLNLYLSPGQPEAPAWCRWASSRHSEKHLHALSQLHRSLTKHDACSPTSRDQETTHLPSSVNPGLSLPPFLCLLFSAFSFYRWCTLGHKITPCCVFGFPLRTILKCWSETGLAISFVFLRKSMKEYRDKDCQSEFQR